MSKEDNRVDVGRKSKSARNRTIQVIGNPIKITSINEQDYVSLTDMIKHKEGKFLVKNWLRTRSTLEFIAAWESMNNPNFNWAEFDLIRKEAGLNTFVISLKEIVAKTNALGLVAKTGRYVGTYAHKDIAFEFGTC